MNEKNRDTAAYIHFLRSQPAGTIYDDASAQPKKLSKKQQLALLFKPFERCQQCPLAAQGRNSVVFGSGNPEAKLMFVGEGPGRDEDRLGLPFVGRAGKLLTKIIEAMGLDRKEVYITNVVKCRPPGNRAPTPEESGTCKDLLLLKQIEIIQPKIICTLGASATKALLGDDIRISSVRGTVNYFRSTPVVPTFHPAYLLRNPSAKEKVWNDMQKVASLLT